MQWFQLSSGVVGKRSVSGVSVCSKPDRLAHLRYESELSASLAVLVKTVNSLIDIEEVL